MRMREELEMVLRSSVVALLLMAAGSLAVGLVCLSIDACRALAAAASYLLERIR